MSILKSLLFLSFFSFNASAQRVGSKTDTSLLETVIDSTSFSSSNAFNQHWNYFYPWGTDHNGSARMYKKQVTLKENVLQIKATRIKEDEGKSTLSPNLNIKYQSGALHAKHQILITKEYPEYYISGEFKAPISPGTWPAFWLTAVNGWPPETDILEFKGDAENWQNTFITPVDVTTIKSNIPDALRHWHTYTAVLKRVDDAHTLITYYIDGKKKGTHDTNFTNKPLWLIINLQMEGSSGPIGPETETSFYARNIIVKRTKAN
jgi:beta-glucanase (GH16 family)